MYHKKSFIHGKVKPNRIGGFLYGDSSSSKPLGAVFVSPYKITTSNRKPHAIVVPTRKLMVGHLVTDLYVPSYIEIHLGVTELIRNKHITNFHRFQKKEFINLVVVFFYNISVI